MISSKKQSGSGGDCPLDLSVSHHKKPKEDEGPVKKLPKWSPSLEPVNHHHHSNSSGRERKNSWNNNGTASHSPDIKALEKMSEMTRVGGQSDGKMTSPAGRGMSVN
jgi:hypothetical protein